MSRRPHGDKRGPEDQALATQLQPLAEATAKLAQRVADTVLEAKSECWWAATAYYTALHRLAAKNAQVQQAIAPVVDFFAIGRRKKTEPQPT